MAAKKANVSVTMEQWNSKTPAEIATDLVKNTSVEKGHSILMQCIREGKLSLQGDESDSEEDMTALRQTIHEMTSGRVQIDDVESAMTTKGIKGTAKAS